MKHLKKVLLALFAACMLLSVTSVTASAASITYLQTVKDNVVVRVGKGSGYDVKYRVAKKGMVLKAVGWELNSSLRKWYKLTDNCWIYSENVTSHSHSYTGGICNGNGCGYEWPYAVKSASGTFVVTNTSGSKVMSRPYSKKSTHLSTLGYNSTVRIVAKTENQPGNIWYKLSDSRWIYSGDVSPQYTVSYDANGGGGAPGTQWVAGGRAFYLSSVKPYRSQHIFKGWSTSQYASAASYAPGAYVSVSKNVTLYAVWKACDHDYQGGVCSVCGYTFPLKFSSCSGTYIVTNSTASIWSMPYSTGASRKVRTDSNQTALTVVAKVKNSAGNVWYKLSDGNYVFSGNVTEQFKVTYNANGGTMPSTYQKYLKGSSVKVTSTKPTRVGYIFKGWATSSSSSIVYFKAGDKYAKEANSTLYAVWRTCGHQYEGGVCTVCKYTFPLKVTSYKATFVVTNSTASIWSMPYSTGASRIVRTAKNQAALSVVSKVVNSADNVWYKLSDGTYVYSGNVTEQFKLSYSANGGKMPTTYQKYLKGGSVKVTSTKPTRVGYVFTGWSTSSTTKVWDPLFGYKAGETYSKQSNTTLYAVWKACSHKYEGGVCTVCKYTFPLKTAAHNGTFIVTNSTASIWSMPYSTGASRIVRTAKNQAALSVVSRVVNSADNVWYKLSDGNYVYAGNVTEQFKLTYNANGGKMPTAYQKYLKGGSVKVTSTKPTRVGYVFQGWATSKTATSVSYKAGDKYNKQLNTTLYAVWKACSHKYEGGVCTVCKYTFPLKTISYSGAVVVTATDGAKIWTMPYSTGASKTVRIAKNQEALSVVAKVSNSANNIWYKLSDGRYVYSGNVTVRYKLTYDANGGTMPTTYQLYLTGKSVKITSRAPSRVGYVFQGWSTSKTATSATYKAGNTYSTKANTTLYAVWKTCSHQYAGGVCTVCKYTYPLSVSTYNGTFAVTTAGGAKIWSIPYSSGASKILRVAPVNSTMTVVAKVRNAHGDIWYKLSNDTYVYSGNVAQQYKVTYNANGGTMPATYQTYLSGKSVAVTSRVPTRVGYVFQGWSTSKTATSATYKAGNSYSTKANTTLYAVWKACAHQYEGTVCTVCKYQYPLNVTACNGVYAVTANGGANIWSKPYTSGDSKIVRSVKQKANLTVVGQVKNPSGSVWYKLSDGNWIYSGNVKKTNLVIYSTADVVSVSGTYTVSSVNGANVWSKPYTSNGSKLIRTVKKGATVTAIGKVKNSSGGTWYRLSDGNWIYSENVTRKSAVSYSTSKVVATSGTYVVTSYGANVWSKPYSSGTSKFVRTVSQGATLTVTAKVVNTAGDTWYKLSDGNWIYGNNIAKK